MPEGKGTYDHIRLEPAENGFIVSYMAEVQNPNEPQSIYNPDATTHKRFEEVFEAGSGKGGMKKALSSAIDRFKGLHAINLGLD